MNIETRKIEFVQRFLRLKNEKTISQLEKILKRESEYEGSLLEPMTEAELNERIDQSEADFVNNRFKSSAELMTKYE